MKTGRLLKFHRPGGEVHAYVYREGALVHAALFVLSPQAKASPEPMQSFSGGDDMEVEASVRAWIEEHFPRNP
jgi:hypothetical protein